MSVAVLTPTPSSTPRPVKFTAAEFDRMGDMGWFEGRRAFLFDGMIQEQGPMNPLHASGIILVNEVLRNLFAQGWVIRCQLPLHLDDFNNPLPDFAVVPGAPRKWLGRHPSTASLIVEVSDTTLAFDLHDKAELYAKAGIEEYWVLDLVNRRLLVHRDPDRTNGCYPAPAVLTSTARVAPLAAPSASALVADLLP